MQKHFAVDGNEANVQHKVGVSVYTAQLLSYFQKNASEHIRFTVFLRDMPREDMPSPTDYFKYEVVQGAFGWSQLFLPLRLHLNYLKGIRYDVFFSPAHYIPRFCPYKTVVTIHDLSYIYFPNEFLKKDLYQLTHWTSYAIEKSVKIISVSKTTKKDILKEYPNTDNKVAIIYNGYAEEVMPNPKKTERRPPYFLYLGTIQPRKNIKFMILAFSQFIKSHPEYQLIIAGKMGWLSEDVVPYVNSLGLNKTVLFPGFVSEEEKNNLYRNAAAYILPSLYEGFGIPLLEAMSHSCPVISSFKSSLPEVGGEACLYFDPNDSVDLVEKMELIVSDKKMRNDLIKKGLQRTKTFSWIKAGEETLALLQSI
ncbi:MAG: glycosyltransferase family 1 protein [Microgenomates group bacterium]